MRLNDVIMIQPIQDISFAIIAGRRDPLPCGRVSHRRVAI